RPRDAIAAERRAHELPRAPADDRDHGRADPVERTLHPREPAVPDVERRQREHHDERRRDERERDERRAARAGGEPAEVDRELRRERARGELREREAFAVVGLGEPAPVLDEVAMHVADERDRSTEPGRAEAEEVEGEIAQREAGRYGFADRLSAGCHDFRFRKAPWSASKSAAPRARRSGSSEHVQAMPAITRSTPAVSGRPYFESFRSTSWTISAIALRPGSRRPKSRSRTSNVQRSPSCVNSASNMSKRSSPGAGA